MQSAQLWQQLLPITAEGKKTGCSCTAHCQKHWGASQPSSTIQRMMQTIVTEQGHTKASPCVGNCCQT